MTGERNRLRLSGNIKPVSYKLRLQPFLGINSTVDGSVSIQIRVLKFMKRIRLHMENIDIKPKGLKVNH